MKPCWTNRKLLASLAVDALDARRTRDLRAHVETCEGCRRYLAEISAVTQNLAAVEMEANIQPGESFHQELVGKLRAEGAPPVWGLGMARVRKSLLNWRIALPVAAAASCLAFLALEWPRTNPANPQAMLLNPPVSTQEPKPDLSPTFANYQMIANQSLEEFDELLSKQGNRNPFPARNYLASGYEE